jgi:hypothetical protein
MEDTTKLRASFRGQFKRLSKFSIVHTGAQVYDRFARRPFEMPSRQCFKAAADSSTPGAISSASIRLAGTLRHTGETTNAAVLCFPSHRDLDIAATVLISKIRTPEL